MKKFGKYTLIVPQRGRIPQKDENKKENCGFYESFPHNFKLNAYLDVIERHKRLLGEIKRKAEGEDVN